MRFGFVFLTQYSLFAFRLLPEYGDMDPSCGLTDDRACR